MRPTSLCKEITGVTCLYASELRIEDSAIVFEVRPRWRKARCGGCGQAAPVYDRRPLRRWRHLPVGSTVIWLSYAPRRVACETCGVRTEQVPWAAPGSRFTRALEELAAYLAQATDRTAVTRLLGISWRSVGRIIERIVTARLDESRFDGLRCIGVDEFSYRKRHRYLTVVVDHDRRRVIWAGPGRSSDTLEAFFDAVGEDRLAAVEAISIDMAAGFIKAIDKRLAHAQIVFDRFHVQRLVSDALDEVRRAQVRELGDHPQAAFVKGSRYALLKNPWNLTRKDQQRLAAVQANNAALYRGHLLKETLARALDYLQPWRARRALDEWLAWASRSRLKPFVKAARTIRKYKEGILAYIDERHTNARVEGINNRLRMIARRAFGFHGSDSLIAMLFLCCGGIELNPPLPK